MLEKCYTIVLHMNPQGAIKQLFCNDLLAWKREFKSRWGHHFTYRYPLFTSAKDHVIIS